MLFFQLINVKMPVVGILRWHFNIYEPANFRAQMSSAYFYNMSLHGQSNFSGVFSFTIFSDKSMIKCFFVK